MSATPTTRDRLFRLISDSAERGGVWASEVDRFLADRDAETLTAAGWVPCSPEWMATHPGECGTARRVAGYDPFNMPDGLVIAHWHPAVTRAEVLREAGGLADELIAGVSRADSEAFARVDSFRAYSDRLHEIADSGVVPAGESTQPTPGFFQSGHGYTRPSCGRAATFQVTHVSTAPDGSSVTAFGWHQIEGYDIWQAYSSEDFENAWTEVPRG